MSKAMQVVVESFGDRLIRSDAELVEAAFTRRGTRIQTVNLHHLALGRRSKEFASVLSTADQVTADGWPLVWALEGLGLEVSRVTGSSFVTFLSTNDIRREVRLGLVGASVEAGDLWNEILSGVGRSLVFREHGDRSSWVAEDLARGAVEAGVELLLVAVTPPYGDSIAEEIKRAGFRGVILPVGGSIDMVTGLRQRAPVAIQRIGMEWAYRLILEPKRLMRRYVLECIPTMVLFLVPYVAGERFRRRRSVDRWSVNG